MTKDKRLKELIRKADSRGKSFVKAAVETMKIYTENSVARSKVVRKMFGLE